jgi:hypothetical protein
VETYHHVVCAADFCCDGAVLPDERTIPTEMELAFFETRHSYGRTALLLSGGAALGFITLVWSDAYGQSTHAPSHWWVFCWIDSLCHDWNDGTDWSLAVSHCTATFLRRRYATRLLLSVTRFRTLRSRCRLPAALHYLRLVLKEADEEHYEAEASSTSAMILWNRICQCRQLSEMFQCESFHY